MKQLKHPTLWFLSPGANPGHRGPHRRLHVAPPLVHVAGHLRLPPCHRCLPHPIRVAQSLWHDAAWAQPGSRLLLLLGAQRVLRHPVWTHGGHQAPQVLDGTATDEPVGHLLSVLPVHLHG